MPSEGSSSSSKWLIGCLVAGFLGVALCAGGAFFVVRTAFMSARDAARQAMQAAQEAQRQAATQAVEAQFEMEWTPPAAGTGSEALFPVSVGAWQRTSQDEIEEFTELGLSRPGRHAVYESGITGIDVYAYEVPADEQIAVFQQAEDAIEAGEYARRTKSTRNNGVVHRMDFSFSPPDRYGLMWWCKGWLFVFIVDQKGVGDMDGFRRDYTALIQPSEPEMEATPELPGSAGDTAPAEQPEPEGALPESSGEAASAPAAETETSTVPPQ